MTAGPALEMWSAQTKQERTDGRSYTVEYTRKFSITLDASDEIDVAETAAGLPNIGQAFPGKLTVFCLDRQLERTSPILAYCTARYRGEVGTPGGGDSDPWNLPYSMKWGTSVEDLEIDQDWNGEPLVNTNSEPITGITEKFYDDIVTIERAFLTINRYALRAYRKAVNSDPFLGWPAGTARLVDDESEAVFIGGVIAYWKVRAVIQFREPYQTTADKAWYKRIRNEGYTERDTGAGIPHPAWDESIKGLPSGQKVLLKADGTRATDPADTYWLEFQTLDALPYSALGLV